ncbi:MAG TPA: type II toxin-antitoxin system VapB family antitoxin, partial [Acetobacteraceae bacterium]|nr:type II toxin-antitoxin system VapB family antitoxin [Acetobacteraceae bacterium]
MLMATAKVFWSGRSQAVRLPKEFRVEGDEVRIRREGRSIILEPLQNDWAWLDTLVRETAASGCFNDEFLKATEAE